jgi:large subunit ribosomal protein L31
MKKDLHAKDYRLVIFEDLNDGSRILTRSTVRTDETAKYEDGKEYPIVKVHISSSSHPFYSGQEKVLDLEGRVDRFKAREAAAKKAQEARIKSASKTRAKKPADKKAE